MNSEQEYFSTFCITKKMEQTTETTVTVPDISKRITLENRGLGSQWSTWILYRQKDKKTRL